MRHVIFPIVRSVQNALKIVNITCNYGPHVLIPGAGNFRIVLLSKKIDTYVRYLPYSLLVNHRRFGRLVFRIDQSLCSNSVYDRYNTTRTTRLVNVFPVSVYSNTFPYGRIKNLTKIQLHELFVEFSVRGAFPPHHFDHSVHFDVIKRISGKL